MKIDKAIEILTLSSNKGIVTIGTDSRKAINLGIEALKRCQLTEPRASFYLGLPLPGETPE